MLKVLVCFRNDTGPANKSSKEEKHLSVPENLNETETFKSEKKVFKCHHCFYTTTWGSNFKRHILVHKNLHEINTFKCRLCPRAFRHKASMKRHFRMAHETAKKEFKCHRCFHLTTNKFAFNQHMLLHKNDVEKFKCVLCPYEAERK